MVRKVGGKREDAVENVADVAAAPLTARGINTRKKLLLAARRIFERDGFLATRITDIAEDAGVAHGSFYSYFDSKEEIFRELFLDVEATMLVHPEETSARHEPWELIEAANRRYLEVYRDNAALMANWEQVAAFDTNFSKLLRDWGNEHFIERAERAIRRWQAEGLADPKIEPLYAAHALGNMVTRVAYLMFSIGEPQLEFEEAVAQLTRLWANSLGIREPAILPTRAGTADRGSETAERPPRQLA